MSRAALQTKIKINLTYLCYSTLVRHSLSRKWILWARSTWIWLSRNLVHALLSRRRSFLWLCICNGLYWLVSWRNQYQCRSSHLHKVQPMIILLPHLLALAENKQKLKMIKMNQVFKTINKLSKSQLKILLYKMTLPKQSQTPKPLLLSPLLLYPRLHQWENHYAKWLNK